MEAGVRKYEKPNIKGDRLNIMLLLLMYSFQGAVFGLTQAFSIILQNRNVSFSDQAAFSFVNYPFCFKLFWAPLVDCMFSKRFGRRKTWIVPTQYFMGIILFASSIYLDDLLGSADGSSKPKLSLLTVIFFICTLFSSMQDVALDGWSLTMLHRRNVGYAVLCQNVGLAIGQFVAYFGFLVLDSKDFCNRFRSVPQSYGFVSLSEFIFLWSMIFMITTTIVLIFKKDDSLEVSEDDTCDCRLGLKESYKHLWNIFRLRPMLMACTILATYFVGFGSQYGVAHLKMIEMGVSRDSFALLTVPALPLQIILSIFFRRNLVGTRSMNSFIKYYILQLILGVLTAVVLFLSPLARDAHQLLPVWYYCVLFLVYNITTVTRNLLTTTLGAFFCRISDPRFGGMYLTLVNAVHNVGINWPTTLSLWLVDPLTVRACVGNGTEVNTSCMSKFDGFYTETILFTVLGGLWLSWGRRQIYKLKKLDASAWIFEREGAKVVEDEKLPMFVHTTEK